MKFPKPVQRHYQSNFGIVFLITTIYPPFFSATPGLHITAFTLFIVVQCSFPQVIESFVEAQLLELVFKRLLQSRPRVLNLKVMKIPQVLDQYFSGRQNLLVPLSLQRILKIFLLTLHLLKCRLVWVGSSSVIPFSKPSAFLIACAQDPCSKENVFFE